MSRIGLKFGDLTVVAESNKAVFCRCKCGAEDWYPSEISKSTYRHRRMCARCAGRPCEICGKWINAQAGSQSPTCSIECRKLRANRREKERYQIVKNTEHWREVRQAQIKKIKAHIETDLEFAAAFRAYSRLAVEKNLDKINSDPARRIVYLQSKRESAADWRAKLIADPVAHETHKKAARKWYASLSQSEKNRIYLNPQRDRLFYKRIAKIDNFLRSWININIKIIKIKN